MKKHRHKKQFGRTGASGEPSGLRSIPGLFKDSAVTGQQQQSTKAPALSARPPATLPGRPRRRIVSKKYY